jgi:hypothetical protein
MKPDAPVTCPAESVSTYNAYGRFDVRKPTEVLLEPSKAVRDITSQNLGVPFHSF